MGRFSVKGYNRFFSLKDFVFDAENKVDALKQYLNLNDVNYESIQEITDEFVRKELSDLCAFDVFNVVDFIVRRIDCSTFDIGNSYLVR